MAPPFARRPRGPPARPRARHRRSIRSVSRFPAGPGSPEEAKPRTDAPSSRTACWPTLTSAARLSSGVAHHAALADLLAGHLELGLDHGEHVEARRGSRHNGRKHLRQRDERHVGHDQVRCEGQLVSLQRAGVAPLEHGHALVVAKPPVKLAIGNVVGDHRGRAALKQTVCEAACRRAHVECVAAAGIDPKGVERIGELHAPTRDERRPFGHRHVSPVGHELARLMSGLAAHADVAGHHRGSSARA